MAETPLFDLLVVGGGINGVGIARDAAGRGLSVLLIERGDLAGATSSASSKLIHGGLRYLEQGQFRLVRESLAEREVLMAAAPHLIRPLRFVLPVHGDLRPAWLLRLGLFLYDHVGSRDRLPPSRTVRRTQDSSLAPLKPSYQLGFEYSDCCADDARLVVINAIDARSRGACIALGWALVAARRENSWWCAELTSRSEERRTVRVRALVNAAGPWVEDVLRASGVPSKGALRLVKGSHIIVPRLYAGPQAYTLQSHDGRVVFIIPFEDDFTLIGTTDIPLAGDLSCLQPSNDEIAYLCRVISDYLENPVTATEVIWSYAGVRPLYDDGERNVSTVTRDYAFDIDESPAGAPMLSIFGGKLTSYRRLAEGALSALLPKIGHRGGAWTRGATLPGGDIPQRDIELFCQQQLLRYPFVPPSSIRRLCRAYGTRIERVLGGARGLVDLGRRFGPGLYECELQWMRDQEWAHSADDALWRRSKLGLRLNAAQRAQVVGWFAA